MTQTGTTDTASVDALASESEAVLEAAEKVFGKADIEAALDTMATDISNRLAARNPLLLCVVIGGIVPTGMLLPRLRFPLQLDYIHASRYRGQTQGGELQWIRRPEVSLEGRTVLVVDDVLDEGYTLQAILQDCRSRGAAEVLSAVLVDKRIGNRPGLKDADFVGLEADDRYLFGAGMDYKSYLRNLDGVFALSPRS